jgi:hypothetical protein
MTLCAQLAEYISACFTGLWIASHEHDDALREIARLCREQDWRLATWNVDVGLQVPSAGQPSAEQLSAEQPADAGGNDPLAAIRSINALASPDSSAVLVLENFHRFLQSAEVVQALAGQIIAGKQNRTFIVVLAPVVDIPVELQKLFVVVEHDLPTREQLVEIAEGVATEEGELPEGVERDRVLDAAAGLTRHEAENAFSLSLVRHGAVRPDVLWQLKGQTLEQNGLLRLHRGEESFAGLGGLDALKSFCLRAMRQQGNHNPLKRPRGVMLLSPPGCGKSQFAKCLGNETGRPTLILDVGALYGSLVGQTEQNIRRAIQTIEAMAPCVVLIDEVEKALAGAGSSGQTDSGVSARLFGTLLSWMNDRTSDVFLLTTCNDISKLPPEFSRSERVDGVWFLDLPGPEQRQAIWQIYLGLFELDANQPRPNDDGWTGAEIRACCRLAALLDVPLMQAARNVVPIAQTAGESVEQLRSWAAGRCLDADRGGIHASGKTVSNCRRPSRRVRRGEPSDN